MLCYTRPIEVVISEVWLVEEEFISKKDLLQITGISYGQLYRWKRKNIIPEEWFIKKSSFTGQETFFPKAKVMERINKIKDMKEDLSLDDLAEKFSPKPSEVIMNEEELTSKNIITQSTLNIYKTMHTKLDRFSFEQILYMSILERFLMSGEVSFEEGKSILGNLENNYNNFKGKDCEIIFMRKFGIGLSMLLLVPVEFYIENTAKLVLRVNISKFVEELKLKLI
jgi:hypothetical protein